VVDEFTVRAYTAYSRAVVAVAAHGLFGGLVGLGLTKRHVLGQVCAQSEGVQKLTWVVLM